MGAEGYGLLNMFMRLQERFGLVVAIVVTIIVGLIILALPLLGYYLKTRIDIMRQDQAAREAERVHESAERDKERAAKERERAALLQELAETRAQVHEFLNNHLAHLKDEREEHTKALKETAAAQQEICHTLREVSTDLRNLREDGNRRAGVVHEKLETIHREVITRRPGPSGPIA